MPLLILHGYTISLDGYGAGPQRSLESPLGNGGEALHDRKPLVNWSADALALVLALLVGSTQLLSQELVPNGEFEQYYGCPNNAAQIDSLVDWFNPATVGGGSPDYFNVCGSGLVDVPLNFSGFQQPRGGSGYVGLIAYMTPWIHEYREYVEVGLSAPLVKDSCYRFSMHVSLARAGTFATESLGAYFSDSAIADIPYDDALPFTPQVVNSTGFIVDTVGWTEVSGIFVADGGEEYVTIGNFLDDTTLSLALVDSALNYHLIYFYIDDVSLTPTSCSVGMADDPDRDATQVFPNPTSGMLQIRGLNPNTQVAVFDLSGRLVLMSEVVSNLLDLSSLADGVYHLRRQSEQGTVLCSVVLHR